MWWVKSLCQVLSVNPFIISRNNWDYFLPARKCWFRNMNLFGRNPLVGRDLLGNAGKCLRAAGKLLLSHRDPRKEMGTWTGTHCCCISMAVATSHHIPHLRGHFSLHFDQLIQCGGADITASCKDWQSTQPKLADEDQNCVSAHWSVTNLVCILFLHTSRKYWSPRKVPWHRNINFHSAQIKCL